VVAVVALETSLDLAMAGLFQAPELAVLVVFTPPMEYLSRATFAFPLERVAKEEVQLQTTQIV
jgi:hypothetical protein